MRKALSEKVGDYQIVIPETKVKIRSSGIEATSEVMEGASLFDLICELARWEEAARWLEGGLLRSAPRASE